jgi:hypothetical protein
MCRKIFVQNKSLKVLFRKPTRRLKQTILPFRSWTASKPSQWLFIHRTMEVKRSQASVNLRVPTAIRSQCFGYSSRKSVFLRREAALPEERLLGKAELHVPVDARRAHSSSGRDTV